MLPRKAARPPADNWQSAVNPRYRDFFAEILNDADYMGCVSFRDQCRILIERRSDIPVHQIGLFFGVNSKVVWKQKSKIENGVLPHGRPSVITPDQSAAMIEYIRQRIDLRDPPTLNDVLNFLWQAFELDMLPNTLRKWIQKHTAFAVTLSKPMEQERLQLKEEDIVLYYNKLEEAVRDVPSGLILNLDESGFAKYADARDEAVVLPKECDWRHYPVTRREKRATFLLTVSADGRCLKPLLIVPRSTLESEVLLAGYTSDEAIFVKSANGYITRDLFERYLVEVVVPYINLRRHELEYRGYAVLTMDNCSCHTSQDVERICRENGVRLVFLPPHSSDQTQPCDLGLFGNMKGAQSRVHPPPDMSVQSRQIIRILSAYRAVCHPLAVTSAFRRAGLSTFLKDGRLFSAVTRHTCSALRTKPREWETEESESAWHVDGKERIAIGSGLWGVHQDKILSVNGLFTFKEHLREADLVPDEIEPDATSSLVQTIQTLWDGVVPDHDESDDPDWEYEASSEEEEHCLNGEVTACDADQGPGDGSCGLPATPDRLSGFGPGSGVAGGYSPPFTQPIVPIMHPACGWLGFSGPSPSPLPYAWPQGFGPATTPYHPEQWPQCHRL